MQRRSRLGNRLSKQFFTVNQQQQPHYKTRIVVDHMVTRHQLRKNVERHPSKHRMPEIIKVG